MNSTNLQESIAQAQASAADYAAVQSIREEQGDIPAPPKQEPFRHTTPRIRRNDPCPCGSGQKFKRCHQRAQTEAVKMIGAALAQAEQALADVEIEPALAQSSAA